MKYLLEVLFILLLSQNILMAEYKGLFGSLASGKKSANSTEYKNLSANKILLWGGFHNHFYGYEDVRYKDEDDQGDYIKTDARQFGFEFNLSEPIDSAILIVYGLNFSGYRQGSIKQRTLYAVPLHGIPEETFPASDLDRGMRWWYNIGFFGGADINFIRLDLGLTVRVSAVEEKTREKLDPGSDPSNPTYIKGEGRGLIFDDTGVVFNALLRIGYKNRPNFTISFFRGDYDIIYGKIHAKLVFPVGSYFSINFGGYLYESQSIFVEPVVKFSGVSVAFKPGLILNYHDSEYKKIDIRDSITYSFSLSYEW